MGQKQPTKRVFIWRFKSDQEKAAFEKFRLLTAICEQQSAEEALSGFIKTYLNFSKVKFTPIYETEMISTLRDLGYKSNRRWLKNLRETGQLVDKSGFDLWFTGGRSIVYNKEGVIKFVKARMKKGRA